MSKRDRALKIADQIIDDLTDRRGLKQEWWDIDDEIQESIRQQWADFIEAGL